ncbi:NYN domain-containing protein [Pelagophyceae sp. CCMP2097]|nr:NYN domain-containing protein [Pelagophyceae sp. CCMP2097]
MIWTPTKKKNASDIALCIDAMDIINQKGSAEVDTFVLVTNDGDFAPLAQRLRRQGKQVIAVGSAYTNLSASVDHTIKIDFTKHAPAERHTASDVLLLQDLTYDATVASAGLEHAWITVNFLANFVDGQGHKDWRQGVLEGFVNFRHLLESDP